mmetsp:Transcript_92652/g.163343  ORF Transcript_92652/g.163343 Transcript_92652/m.163343 type:complete len:278 (-) Transcript_92652:103-936(-)
MCHTRSLRCCQCWARCRDCWEASHLARRSPGMLRCDARCVQCQWRGHRAGGTLVSTAEAKRANRRAETARYSDLVASVACVTMQIQSSCCLEIKTAWCSDLKCVVMNKPGRCGNRLCQHVARGQLSRHRVGRRHADVQATWWHLCIRQEICKRAGCYRQGCRGPLLRFRCGLLLVGCAHSLLRHGAGKGCLPDQCTSDDGIVIHLLSEPICNEAGHTRLLDYSRRHRVQRQRHVQRQCVQRHASADQTVFNGNVSSSSAAFAMPAAVFILGRWLSFF